MAQTYSQNFEVSWPNWNKRRENLVKRGHTFCLFRKRGSPVFFLARIHNIIEALWNSDDYYNCASVLCLTVFSYFGISSAQYSFRATWSIIEKRRGNFQFLSKAISPKLFSLSLLPNRSEPNINGINRSYRKKYIKLSSSHWLIYSLSLPFYLSPPEDINLVATCRGLGRKISSPLASLSLSPGHMPTCVCCILCE